ncbi:MAG TPA: DNA-processing protein DprA [Thermoanaerobaculia bacterium]|nr:DNA-processing protein DprA [Thermoanaerobaculia bacterium]
MHSDDRDFHIALSLLPFLTPNRTRLLRQYFDPLRAVRDASSALLESLLSVTPEQARLVKNPLILHGPDAMAPLRSSVLTLDEPAYPPLLREIIDPPLALHFLGDTSLLAKPCVAIVGSRRASPYGLNAAGTLARQLVSAGLVIVSGLARGIDAAAHQAALDSGGSTIAVLGTGIDVVYPRSNIALLRRIERDGLILTEFAPGLAPRPENFPIRNRVISGLASGTVIVEATGRSGSLITARMAAEQGREVFAVPGSIFAPGSEGTHRLIQYGAKLVHDANDVLEELPGGLTWTKSPKSQPGEPLREVLAALSLDEGTHLDTLAAKLSRTAGAVSESLLQLELDGWIRALPGGRYLRVRDG